MTNILRFLCAVLLCGAVSTPASAQYLPEDELTRLMAGTTIKTITSGSGLDFYFTFNADGSLDGKKVTPYRDRLDDGKWWTNVGLKSGAARLCFQFEEFGKGRVWCRSFIIEDDGRTIARYKQSGRRLKRTWVITKPGPQVSAVIAAKKAARIAGQSPKAPPQRPLTVARDDAPPVIEVPDSLTAKTAAVEIAGRVSDSSRIVEVTLDGRPVAVGADGSFSTRRGVPTGESTITVAAVDEWGNRATRKVTVRREAVVTQRRIEVPARPSVTAKPRPDPYAGIHFGAYHALVIGNNNYRDLPKLKTAVNDARAVARLLTDDYGFSTTLLIDATRADVIAAMAGMRAKLKANDNLLIYYAGHGVVDNFTEQGYWLPVDAEEAVPTNWVSNNDVTTMLRAIRAKHIMVVADSCYSGTLVRAAAARMKTARGRAVWVKRMVRKRARTALVSGGLEPVTDSGSGGHSVFAGAFLAALRENRNVIDGQTLYQTIKRPVVLNAKQTPQYSDIRLAGHEGGDFVFVRKR